MDERTDISKLTSKEESHKDKCYVLNIILNNNDQIQRKKEGIKTKMTLRHQNEMEKSKAKENLESTLKKQFGHDFSVMFSYTSIEVLICAPEIEDEKLNSMIEIINKALLSYSVDSNSDETKSIQSHDSTSFTAPTVNDASNSKSLQERQEVYRHEIKGAIPSKYMFIASDSIIAHLCKKHSCSVSFSRITKESRKKIHAELINDKGVFYDLIIANHWKFWAKRGLLITTEERARTCFKSETDQMRKSLDDENTLLYFGNDFDLLIIKDPVDKKTIPKILEKNYQENMTLILEEKDLKQHSALLKSFKSMNAEEKNDKKKILIPYQEKMDFEYVLYKFSKYMTEIHSVKEHTMEMSIGTLPESKGNRMQTRAQNGDVQYVVSDEKGKYESFNMTLGPYGRENRSLSILTRALYECLKTAKKSEGTSLYVPVLGILNHGYPADQVAERMLHIFHEYLEFQSFREESFLRHVSIVLPQVDQAIRQAFFDENLKRIRKEDDDDYIYKVELEIKSRVRDTRSICQYLDDIVNNQMDLADHTYNHKTVPNQTDPISNSKNDLTPEEKQIIKELDRKNGARCILVTTSKESAMGGAKNTLHPTLQKFKPLCYAQVDEENPNKYLVVFKDTNDKNDVMKELGKKKDNIDELKDDVYGEVITPVKDAVYKVKIDPNPFNVEITKVVQILEEKFGMTTKRCNGALFFSGCSIQIRLAEARLHKLYVHDKLCVHTTQANEHHAYEEITVKEYKYLALEKFQTDKISCISSGKKIDDGPDIILKITVGNKEKLINALSAFCHEEFDVPADKSDEARSCIEEHQTDKKTVMYFEYKNNKLHILAKAYHHMEAVCHKCKILFGLLKVTNKKKSRTREDRSSSTISDPVEEIYNTPRQKITVIVKEDDITKMGVDVIVNAANAAKDRSSSIFSDPVEEKYNTPRQKITVIVKKQDLTKMGVDVIVNAANGKMLQGGGVARSISVAGGETINQESQHFVQLWGEIPVSGICKTSGGRLQCKQIYHAVGPKWHDYKDKMSCENDLCKTILRCLVEADKGDYTSIAMPSISSAISAVPESVCTRMYVKAVKNFDQYHSVKSLREINFVDVRGDMILSIQKEFGQNLSDQEEDPSMRRFITDITGDTQVEIPTGCFESKIKLVVTFHEVTDGDLTYQAFTLPSDIQIRLYQCDMLSTKSEAITSWEELSFSDMKASSKWIIEKAGDEYKKERSTINKSVLKAGNIVRTSSGRLKQKHIFHFVSSIAAPEEENKHLIENLLAEIDKYKVSSVTIGLVDNAKHLPNTLLEVLHKTSSAALKEVHLVCSSEEKIKQAVEDCKKHIKYLDGIIHEETCPVCKEIPVSPVVLPCNHVHCKACVDEIKRYDGLCSLCRKNIHGEEQTGRHQPDGKTSIQETHDSIYITFTFGDGIQTASHPDPGFPYSRLKVDVILPKTPKGKETSLLLVKAMDNRLLFTVGRREAANEKRGCIVSTDILGNRYDYKDEKYLDELRERLFQKGLTVK